jgi:hypothetical protein
VLHLLNGDASAAVMPASIDGERAVWRDILVEGPPVADGAVRGGWLGPRIGVSAEDYARRWQEGQATLDRAHEHAEVVLWFEQDLFCAVNLWYVVDRLALIATRISLVFPPLADGFDGLGGLGADDFAPLLERRTVLDAGTQAGASALWRAYAASEPTALVTLARDPALPFTARAVRLHCGRFPSASQGLSEVETAALEMLARQSPMPFVSLFAAVTRRPELKDLGMGDVQFAWLMRELAACEPALLRIDDTTLAFAGWTLSATPVGSDALAGRVDRLALCPIDRWLGGVHIAPSRPTWRWDARAVRLLAPDAG